MASRVSRTSRKRVYRRGSMYKRRRYMPRGRRGNYRVRVVGGYCPTFRTSWVYRTNRRGRVAVLRRSKGRARGYCYPRRKYIMRRRAVRSRGGRYVFRR